VKLDPVRRQLPCRQANFRMAIDREDAAKSEVVNRENARRLQSGILREIDRHQSGVPVMRMHHVGNPIRIELARCDMCRNPAQQREAPMVVVPVVTIGTDVGVAFPLIQERRIDHIGGQTAVGQPSQLQGHDSRTKNWPDPEHGLEIDHAFHDPGQARD
jgi:hypothetical protein